MRFDLLTLHPGLLISPLEHSILGRARAAGLVEVNCVDIRDFAKGRHRQADDAPYGGGAGMVMKVDVVARAIASVRSPESRVILLTPAGKPLCQEEVSSLSACTHVILVCGHYEGIDARVESLVDQQVSIGDYILTGGELAALVVVDAVARLLPGVLGNDASAQQESFSTGCLEYPQFTRPRVFEGMEVPEVLLSGDHARIEAWRKEKAEERTRALRPDLLES